MANDLDPIKPARGTRRDPSFAAAMTALRAAFPPGENVNVEEQFATYWWSLQDLAGPDMLEAAKRIVQREPRMPTIVQLREEVYALRTEREAAAKAKPAAPTRATTTQRWHEAADRIVARTIESNEDHVNRLVAKCEGKLVRAEVLWRIERILQRPAREAAHEALFGKGEMPQELSFEVYNREILDDLACWARLPAGTLQLPASLMRHVS